MFLKITKLAIPDLLLLEPRVFGDERGFFFESFNAKNFRLTTGFQSEFVQDNHSKSVKGVVRGLHYQLPPMAQAKLVRVVQGEVFDVAVDIRKNSATFGEWVGTALSAQNKHILWIPEGFAHGFMTISDTAEFLYKTTNYYDPDLERGIRWDDPQINIRWPISEKIQLSAKDERNGLLKNAECF